MPVFDTFDDLIDDICGLGKVGVLIIVGIIVFGAVGVVASNT